VLLEDETDLLLFPPLRAAWGLRGRPLEVPISGSNARRVVFGAINVDSGRRLFLVRRHQRGEDFRAFLAVVRSHYRGWRVALLLDEDRSHTAGDSQGLAVALGIRLIWLPKRCPELNGMDHLWGHGKDHVCANRQYGNIDEEAGRFVQYLQSFSNQEALLQAGILSENSWLRV
jgi:DDE superfamily endonuclease